MLLNSPIHTRQTEAGAFTELSYRTEGFEQMGLDFRGDAAAGVGNGKADELCRSSKACPGCLGIIPGNDLCLHSEAAARRHRIARIQDEIHDDVLKHASVGQNHRQVRSRRVFESNRFAHQAAEHRI